MGVCLTVIPQKNRCPETTLSSYYANLKKTNKTDQNDQNFKIEEIIRMVIPSMKLVHSNNNSIIKPIQYNHNANLRDERNLDIRGNPKKHKSGRLFSKSRLLLRVMEKNPIYKRYSHKLRWYKFTLLRERFPFYKWEGNVRVYEIYKKFDSNVLKPILIIKC
ncbi:hypothetical protein H8356DRAFT_1340518 [Neocallimastix lanati (nom. inval.)]|nr:hypothetical protein H8356DRAFT_1340518 [Neocallimastix sp. JGI-2020a]